MYYETIFIVNPDISQENTELLTNDFIAKVEKAGGRIVKREYWGTRPLAYSIAKRKRGHYVLLVTDGDAKALNALERAINLDERVIRSLTTRIEEPTDEPSPLMRRRGGKASEPGSKAESEATETEPAPAPETAEEGGAEASA